MNALIPDPAGMEVIPHAAKAPEAIIAEPASASSKTEMPCRMDEEKLRTLLKYVKDQKTEAETLARDLSTQRANKDQKARTERDPARSKRFLHEAVELRRRCF